MSCERRQKIVDTGHPALSVRRQCRILKLQRSTYYYQPIGESAYNLALMKRIDELFMELPFFGSRQMRNVLRDEGHQVGRNRVRRLMRKMGLMAVYQKPRTSQPHPQHKTYPYLLRGKAITRLNQVWCADITYIPMKRGFLYLVAIMDWHSRAVLSWQLSNTMEADFCVAALEEALNRYGVPEMFNTDQGSQFTGCEFTRTLRESGVRISMDGRGRWMDNVMIERLWRSLKYECVYLRELETGSELRQALSWWFDFYNNRRPHRTFDGRKPMEIYQKGPKPEGGTPSGLGPQGGVAYETVHLNFAAEWSNKVNPLLGSLNTSSQAQRHVPPPNWSASTRTRRPHFFVGCGTSLPMRWKKHRPLPERSKSMRAISVESGRAKEDVALLAKSLFSAC